MIRSGWENVCRNRRPSSTSRRHRSMTSFGDRQRPPVEHRPYRRREPIVQSRLLVFIIDTIDPEPRLSQGHDADVKAVEVLRSHEGDDVSIRFGATELGQHIGIEQPFRHSDRSRTGKGPRSGAISTSRYGEVAQASIRA